MSLSTREKRALGGIADRLHAEDPALARALASFATGAIITETLPSRRRVFPVVLLGAVMTIMAVALPAVAGTAPGSGPTTHVFPRG